MNSLSWRTLLGITLCGLLSAGISKADIQPAELIANAVAQKQSRIVIPAGIYHLKPGIVIDGAKDLEIVAQDVTFVFAHLSRGITFKHCTNVTLSGLTIDYDPLPFTQGKVMAVANDNSWIDVQIDAGYPRVPYSRIDVCDPVTRTRKRGMPFMWGTKAKLIEPDVVRVTLKDIGQTAKMGDPVSLSGGPAEDGSPHGMTLESCSGMTLRNVTVYTAPGMGILESDGEGNANYLGVKVVPGPPPAGATEPRLLSTTWDAMQSKVTRKGPLLEGCEIRDAGDDSWSVQSSDYVVLSVQGREVLLGYRDQYCNGPQVNDRLRLSLDGPEAVVQERTWIDRTKADLSADVLRKLANAQDWTFWKISSRTLKVTLDRQSPFSVGQSVYCPDRQCDGFIVRKCKFRSPGRGALIKGGDGVIEDNEFIDCHSAVTVSAEVPGGAASGIRGIVIRNNRISGTGYFGPLWNSTQAGAISVSGAAGSVRDITIEGNSFDDINGVNICIIGADNVMIRGNRFIRLHQTLPQNTGAQHGIDQHSVIFADRCTNLDVEGNVADAMGPFTRSLLKLGKGTINQSTDNPPLRLGTPATQPSGNVHE